MAHRASASARSSHPYVHVPGENRSDWQLCSRERAFSARIRCPPGWPGKCCGLAGHKTAPAEGGGLNALSTAHPPRLLEFPPTWRAARAIVPASEKADAGGRATGQRSSEWHGHRRPSSWLGSTSARGPRGEGGAQSDGEEGRGALPSPRGTRPSFRPRPPPLPPTAGASLPRSASQGLARGSRRALGPSLAAGRSGSRTCPARSLCPSRKCQSSHGPRR